MSFTANSTGGKYKHTLTVNEMPSHKHDINAPLYSGNSSPGGSSIQGNNNGAGTWPYQWCQNTGGNQAHNNVQPYIVVYFWKRTT